MDSQHKYFISGNTLCKEPSACRQELRTHVFTDLLDSDRKATKDTYIYCENDAGQGHRQGLPTLSLGVNVDGGGRFGKRRVSWLS